MTTPETWFIVKNPDQTCEIVPEISNQPLDKWGPYATRDEAIAKRVGLIRAGKCQPI